MNMATIQESHVISIEDLKDPACAHADAVIDSFGRSGVPCGISDIRGMIADGFKVGAQYALSHQWVSVEERLPDDGRLVLAHFPDADPELRYSTAYYMNGTWKPFDDWYCDCKIDSWMPIPQFNPEK